MHVTKTRVTYYANCKHRIRFPAYGKETFETGALRHEDISEIADRGTHQSATTPLLSLKVMEVNEEHRS